MRLHILLPALLLAGPAFAQGYDAAADDAAAEGSDKPELAEDQADLTTDKTVHQGDQVDVDLESEKSEEGPAESDEAEADRGVKEDHPEEDYGHGMQFGLRAGLVGGFRMVFRYEDSAYCREIDFQKAPSDQQKFCGHVAPLALDLGLSFAPIDAIEPFLWFRLGLQAEDETNTDPLRVLGVGIRIYTMPDALFKIFIQPAVGYEFEGGGDNQAYYSYGNLNPEYQGDLLFHISAGPTFDVHRMFGLYLTGGMSVGVLRAIHSSLELQGGLQFRAP